MPGKQPSIILDDEKPVDASPSTRIKWLDYAKGIGIICVVIGHTLRGLVNASLMSELPAYLVLDEWIYSFHMPLFLFLSGLLIPRGLQKGLRTFLGRKVKTILYPYFVWSIIQGSIGILSSRFTNDDSTLKDLILIPLAPIDQFWFLYALFNSIVIISVLLTVGLRCWQLLGIACLAEFYFPQIIHFFLTHTGFFPPGVVVTIHSFMFVVFGALIGSGISLEKVDRWSLNLKKIGLWLLTLGCALLLYQLAVFALITDIEHPISVFFDYLTATLGIAMVLGISFLMVRTEKFLYVGQLGRLSLEIFVAHTLASSGIRIVLDKFLGVEALLPHILLGTLAGIYVPIFIRYYSDQVKFKYLFVYP